MGYLGNIKGWLGGYWRLSVDWHFDLGRKPTFYVLLGPRLGDFRALWWEIVWGSAKIFKKLTLECLDGPKLLMFLVFVVKTRKKVWMCMHQVSNNSSSPFVRHSKHISDILAIQTQYWGNMQCWSDEYCWQKVNPRFDGGRKSSFHTLLDLCKVVFRHSDENWFEFQLKTWSASITHWYLSSGMVAYCTSHFPKWRFSVFKANKGSSLAYLPCRPIVPKNHVHFHPFFLFNRWFNWHHLWKFIKASIDFLTQFFNPKE